MLNALFDDPESVSQANCPTSGINDCKPFQSEEFPIDADLIDDMYEMTLDRLLRGYQLPVDSENNAKDVETVNANQ